MLDGHYCRLRQERLLERLRQRELDAVVCAATHHVYYFTGHWTFWQQQSGFVLFADGRSSLISADRPAEGAAADELRAYEATWMGTQRQEQPAAVAQKVIEALGARKAGRVGIDASAVSSQVAARFHGGIDVIDEDLFQLRRRKDADELELMKMAIRCCEGMYQRAREILLPGVAELHVFNELHAAAVEAAGEPLSGMLGNDYACGVGGGPARKKRVAKGGELYILDLGPAYRGYFSDNARTFSVDGKPTDTQMKAWEAVVGCHTVVEEMARPGARCRDIFQAADEFLKQKGYKGMAHHLGHGVGLQPHEFPHLNLRWDDVLMEGEVFTAEPGVYDEDLRAGIRIENDYLVTDKGVVNLLNTPMEMV